MLGAGLKALLFLYMGGIIRELTGAAVSINGPNDHIHILASLPATVALSEFVGKVKANSSGWVHKTFPDRREFKWQVGYGAFSVSVSQRPKVLNYTAAQEKHHRTVSFKEEFVGFLKKHGIAFDERYVFDR